MKRSIIALLAAMVLCVGATPGFCTNASKTPAPNTVPIAGASGKIDSGWLPGTYHVQTAADFTAALADPTVTQILVEASFAITVSSTLTINRSLWIEMAPGVEIDASGASAGGVNGQICITGSQGTFYALGAQINPGNTSITANSTLAASLSPGDVIQITTDPSHGGSGTTFHSIGGSSWRGEFVEVLRVSGTTVSLKEPTFDSYTVAEARTCKLSPVTGGLKNFHMKGSGGANNLLIGLSVFYAKDYQILGGNVHGFGYANVMFCYAYKSVVDGLHTSDNMRLSADGTNYGLFLGSVQEVTATNGFFYGGYAGLDVGGWEPNRKIIVSNNHIDSDIADSVGTALTRASSFDSHSNIDGLIAFGNSINNGATLSGGNLDFHGNTVSVALPSASIMVGVPSWPCDYYKIEGNSFYAPFSTQSIGLYIYGNSATNVGLMRVNNNIFMGITGGITLINNVAVPDNWTIGQIEISGNTMRTSASGNNGMGVWFQGGAATALINSNTVLMHNNDIHGASGGYLISNLTSNLLDISGGSIVSTSGGTSTYAKDHLSIGRTVIDNVYMEGSGTAIGAAQIDTSAYSGGFLQWTRNKIINASGNGGAVLTAADILYADNYLDSTTVGNPSLTGRYYSRIFGNGNVVTWYAGSTCSSGTFKIGDICEYLAPVEAGSGGSKYVTVGWSRITNGTGQSFSTDWLPRRIPTGN